MDYLNTKLYVRVLKPDKNRRVELLPMPLFPAAKIRIEPVIKINNFDHNKKVIRFCIIHRWVDNINEARSNS